MYWPLSKSPTGAEFKVIVWLGVILLWGFGLVAILAGVRAPDEKKELGDLAIQYGAVSLGLGVGILVIYWIIGRLCR